MASMKDMKNEYKILVENLKGWNPFEDLKAYGKAVL